MENAAGGAPSSTVETGGGRMGFLARLAGIYFEPRRTLEDVARHGSWLGLYLIVAVLIVGAYWVVTQRVDPETIARNQIEASPMAKRIPPERMDEAVRQASSPARRYIGFAFIPVGVIVTYLASAGALLVVFLVMGAPLTFKKALPLAVWGMGPPTIVLMLLAIVILLVKSPDTIDVADIAGNVTSNLGAMAEAREQPVLHSALASIDLFSFWTIYLLALGFSVASRGSLTLQRALVGVLIPWAVYVAGKTGIKAIFS